MTRMLSGKNAIVTGGTRNIGRAIVLALAKAGANVLTCYRQEDEVVESLSRELKAIGGEHHLVRADVSRTEDVERLVGEAGTRLGSVQILVNNAGVISRIPYAELPLEEWERVVHTNLTAAFLVIQKALPLLGEGSSIINIGSRVAAVGMPLHAHYTASKAGMIGLTRSLCKELGGQGIRVNVVAPGIINTDDTDPLSAQERQHHMPRYQNRMALGRFGKPEEVANVVLFLASDLSAYVNGETIHVDGGV